MSQSRCPGYSGYSPLHHINSRLIRLSVSDRPTTGLSVARQRSSLAACPHQLLLLPLLML